MGASSQPTHPLTSSQRKAKKDPTKLLSQLIGTRYTDLQVSVNYAIQVTMINTFQNLLYTMTVRYKGRMEGKNILKARNHIKSKKKHKLKELKKL